MRLYAIVLFLASVAVSAPGHAADAAGPADQLRVGKTNLFCVTEPCPWRGISSADTLVLGPAELLWSRQSLPPMDANENDASLISAAWNSDQCLVIEGALSDGRLKVERIVGDCP